MDRWKRWSTLCRYLGPWANAEATPHVIRRQKDIPASDTQPCFPMRIYEPTRGRIFGSVFLVPGLHFEGPDHPRMDRFAAILASTGVMVFTPFVPDLLAMSFNERMLVDVERAFKSTLEHSERPKGKPGVISISFGALPCLRLAAHPQHGSDMLGLMTFGGFFDWRATLRFCMLGGDGIAHDPLNRPVVFTNLMSALPKIPSPDDVVEAWHAYMRETWGKIELMEDEKARLEAAKRVSQGLDPESKRLFLQGCDLAPGGPELVYDALHGQDVKSWLDPIPYPERVVPPLWAVHSVTDNVIPYQQSQLLTDAYTGGPSTCLLTGIFGHSGRVEAQSLGALGSLYREMMTLGKILKVLVNLSHGDAP